MGERENTKLKLLYVLEILEKYSDENNILAIGDIIAMLGEKGITCERRSVIRDIKTLEEYGYDISLYEENGVGYFMRSRELEEEELKLLIDTIAASKCITPKKSKELISKLKKQTSIHKAKQIENQIYIDNKIKSKNELIYYNINSLSSAIEDDLKVSFKYTTYNISKEIVYRKEGKRYKVSPIAIAYHEDKYYLIGIHEKYENISHYRVDKIDNVNILNEKRKSLDNYTALGDFDVADYINTTFNMFAGDKKVVKIRFQNELINPVIDKFGTKVFLIPDGEDHFIINSEITISQGFLSWLLQFSSKAELIEPKEVKEMLRTTISELNDIYK